MDDLDKAVCRRLWLNQILSWCIRGSVKGVEYTREQIYDLCSQDEDARANIPEFNDVCYLLNTDCSVKDIEKWLRIALKPKN